MICPKCSSMRIKKNGRKKSTAADGSEKLAQQFHCHSCNSNFSIPINTEIDYVEKKVEPGEVLEVKSDYVMRIHGLTDIHVGAVDFRRDKFLEAVKEIYEDPNARWFGNGDMLECIPPNYKIVQRGQVISPDEQHLAFMDLIRPIQDKCIFIRGGNHDYLRSINMLDYDVSRMIARDMDVPYFELPGYLRVNISGREWYMASGHGASGAKNGDLELDKMRDVYSMGDIFYLGHNHQLYAKPIDSLGIDEDGRETLKRCWYIRGGSFLGYAHYVRYRLMRVARAGWVVMEFKKDDINCWVA